MSLFASFTQTPPRVLVLGLGESGLALARWCAAQGAPLRLVDTRDNPALAERAKSVAPEAEVVIGSTLDPALLDGIDIVGISPGLSPFLAPVAGLVAAARERGIAVWSEIEFFAEALAALKEQRGYAPRLLAITGTNGKTTVTTLAAHLCEHAGRSTIAAGNISPAALEALSDALAADKLPEVWVLELSSFQLQTTHRLVADAAVVLNITEDHLDWHPSMHQYAEAKGRIYANAGLRVANRADGPTVALARNDLAALGVAYPVPVGAAFDGTVFDAATVARAGAALGSASAAAALPPAPVEPEPAAPGRPPRRAPKPVEPVYEPYVSFGLDAPVAAGDFGLIDDGGLRWLAHAEALEDEATGRGRNREVPVRLLRLMPADAVPLTGDHNLANVLAALALVRAAGVPMAAALHGLREFHGLPHRVETIRTLDGIDWIDDSKGTNVGATVAALDGLKRRLVLIAGGDGKGQDFAPLREPVARWARAVLLIGRDAGRLAETFAGIDAAIERFDSLEAATQRAAEIAQPGDAVLLSPACASLDMFRNYAHRAEVFASTLTDIALDRGEPC
ncbi:Mur ligase family protein [Derxia gummosa]|uniref:UDP-N-acetylmuramoylalanine--D-glutamate ligase n=1 Tax=Derxia gummosa DSM 723 TaxID=1121388 RepID=A0A9U5CEM6_9BURK|nr:UDP-N-acetylmuramoyl-L-alanine--D-glutamate ligase [Derxia gummosa]